MVPHLPLWNELFAIRGKQEEAVVFRILQREQAGPMSSVGSSTSSMEPVVLSHSKEIKEIEDQGSGWQAFIEDQGKQSFSVGLQGSNVAYQLQCSLGLEDCPPEAWSLPATIVGARPDSSRMLGE